MYMRGCCIQAVQARQLLELDNSNDFCLIKYIF